MRHAVVRSLLGFCTLAALACSDATSVVRTGQLSVSIGGLPVGIQPAVVITGPDAFRQQVDSSRTLSAVPQGTYTIIASPVTSGGIRYSATPATQTVSVGGDAATTARPIVYNISSAALSVTVIGLPTGTTASVMLTGPGGYTRAIGATALVGLLEPGSYTMSAAAVSAAGKTYRAVRATQVLDLFAFSTATTATVEYGPGSATLAVSITGLPAETDGAVTVTGPGGFSRRLTSTATLGNVEAGSYSIAADLVSSPLVTNTPAIPAQTVAVLDGSSNAVTVAYLGTPLQLGLRLVADGLVQPVFLAAPEGDARQFVVERGGRIRLLVGGVLRATPFLDMHTRVNNVGERGLLSMAFDPQYATNGFFYVYYVDLAGNVVVERIASTPGADQAGGTAGIVMTIPHGGSEHHGGLIAFGPDGMLYVAPGDGGCCGDPQNNAQNLGSLLGKILRIDVRSLPYSVPSSNPFVGQAGTRAEIWAYGLRNPWRYSFDAPSGLLFIGDVGQDAREELDVARASDAGLNYGWRYMEGTACYNPGSNCSNGRALTLPVLEYSHSDGCSIIGGYVYRGAAIPELTGHYLYADYCAGWLRSTRMIGSFATEQRTWAGVVLPKVASFGRDNAGEVYMIAGSQVWMVVRRGL